MTTTVITIINVISAVSLIVLVLMQQSKGDMGSAFGGGGSQSMFGSRGSANFLSRSTSIMCVIFFLTSLALAYLYSNRTQADSVLDKTGRELSVPVNENTGLPTLPNKEDKKQDANSELPSIPDTEPQAEKKVEAELQNTKEK